MRAPVRGLALLFMGLAAAGVVLKLIEGAKLTENGDP